MGYDRSEILLICISLCAVAGGSIFAIQVVGTEYGVLEIPYWPYILLVLAVIIAILSGFIVLTGTERKKEQPGLF